MSRKSQFGIWKIFIFFLSILIKKEIDTSPLLSVIMAKDKQAVIPKIMESKKLEHVLLTDQTILKNNSLGIPEPQNGINISPRIIDVVFYSTLCF